MARSKCICQNDEFDKQCLVHNPVMEVFRVIDDGTVVLTTTDKVKAALKLMQLVEKYDDKQSWFWVDSEPLI